ncbi:hypothetical protein [Pseudonocardia sp. KRD291]|uniref:hypothetical protein n=1 Tax=Pseudonocardia sp. KRD291 TaxID=2792007 RepID=UPI001C4A3822|nr:hypothetical protein [Pseudonocardia sp. KRD291]
MVKDVLCGIAEPRSDQGRAIEPGRPPGTINIVVVQLPMSSAVGPSPGLLVISGVHRWIPWFRSVLAARSDFDVHNDRRLAERRGATPAKTLERFRAVVDSTVAASGHTPAWLGEVVVHGQDIRRPLTGTTE